MYQSPKFPYVKSTLSCLIACAGQNIYAENDTQEVQRLDTIIIQATRTDRGAIDHTGISVLSESRTR